MLQALLYEANQHTYTSTINVDIYPTCQDIDSKFVSQMFDIWYPIESISIVYNNKLHICKINMMIAVLHALAADYPLGDKYELYMIRPEVIGLKNLHLLPARHYNKLIMNSNVQMVRQLVLDGKVAPDLATVCLDRGDHIEIVKFLVHEMKLPVQISFINDAMKKGNWNVAQYLHNILLPDPTVYIHDDQYTIPYSLTFEGLQFLHSILPDHIGRAIYNISGINSGYISGDYTDDTTMLEYIQKYWGLRFKYMSNIHIVMVSNDNMKCLSLFDVYTDIEKYLTDDQHRRLAYWKSVR